MYGILLDLHEIRFLNFYLFILFRFLWYYINIKQYLMRLNIYIRFI